jgi:hypothetical protein
MTGHEPTVAANIHPGIQKGPRLPGEGGQKLLRCRRLIQPKATYMA